MRILCISASALAIVVGTCSWGEGRPNLPAMMTFKVLDEDGEAVFGAEVKMGFERNLDATKPVIHKGRTDKNGLFSARDLTSGHVRGGVWATGCYASFGIGRDFTEQQDGRWAPWNPVMTVLVKRVRNPIPMYVKFVRAGIPALGVPVGYDLMVGDWAAPHGQGATSDLVFTARLCRRAPCDSDDELTVSFSNPGDGIQPFEAPYNAGSELKSPHEAPEDNYSAQWVQIRSRRPNMGETGNYDSTRNYFFRVRSELDEQGRVIKAMYGKIYGDFMVFAYFLNPDGTRNIEYDPKRNLIRGLKRFEDPYQP